MKKITLLALLSIFFLKIVAQSHSSDHYVVRSAEIKAALHTDSVIAVSDTVLRVLSIGAKYNVGVSIVSRSKINGKTVPDAIVHDSITEVYQIIEGRGVLVTGGTLEAPVRVPPDDPLVRKVVGPSSISTKISGGTQREVGPGDIVIIPPHTPHSFTQLVTKRIVYTLIRVDPEKLLELKDR